MLEEEQIEQFDRDGFLIVRGLFDQIEIERFRDAVDRAVVERGEIYPVMDERDPYDQMFTQFYNLWETSPDVRMLAFDGRPAEVAAALVGADRLRLFCDQTFYKEPGSTETGTHQDYPLLCIAEERTVTAWILLDGFSAASGLLQYLPGSHRVRRVTNVDVIRGFDPLADPTLRKLHSQAVQVDISPGDVAFHHVRTFHQAGANRTKACRKALALTYVADGSTRGTAFPHVTLDRDAVDKGQTFGGAASPLVWPTQSHLPPTPPPIPHPPRGWPGYAAPVRSR